jgi:hypothetical protein
MRLLVVDSFAAEAKGLRNHFEARFAEPRRATSDRFVWDLWNVEGQYTALRTPAWEYFPKKLYDAFHQRLVWWGRRTLGCHDVSPPWLSCYVNGCEQRLHGDLPHGPVAFVFSLTPWQRRNFRGGETLLVRDEVLDLWNGFQSVRSIEERDVLEEVPAKFNRLVAFDPRIPHGVRRIDGTMEPRDGRLVIHGWFVQPRPFIEGPLKEKALADAIARVTEALAPMLQDGLPIAGLLSLGFDVAAGRASNVKVLADTLRTATGLANERSRLIRTVKKALADQRFPSGGRSRITLPLVFER